MMAPAFCSGLADLASRYRGFIVDQWGVLHDGARPYADALDCLARLRDAGKRIVLLSNSGKRTSVNRARLAEIGIDGALYDALVTSGEATWQALAERTEPFFEALGRRCILWSRGGDRSTVAGLPLVVERVEDADFLLLAGVEDAARLENFSEQLEAAAARGLPMVCANPDIVAVLPDGGFGMAPGAIAHHYEQLAGASATSASRTTRSIRPASTPSAMCRARRC
jgi:HAD superfamily hydrolase (TIGR01459 family)